MNRKGLFAAGIALSLLLGGCSFIFTEVSHGSEISVVEDSLTTSESHSESPHSSSSASTSDRLPTFWLDNPVYVELEIRNGIFFSSYQLYPLLDGSWIPDVSFFSSDPSIVTVDEGGLVKAVSTGSAIVTATYTENPALSDTIRIEVTTPANFLIVPSRVYLAPGEAYSLIPSFLPSTSTDAREFVYLSSETDVATIEADGTIRALAPGESMVNVYCLSNDYTATVYVRVDETIGDYDCRQISTDPEGTPEYEIVSYHGVDNEPQLPTFYRDGIVVSIGEGAFKGQSGLSEVTVSGSYVREIKDEAFAGCSELTFFYFPGTENPSPLRIGERAFADVPYPFSNTYIDLCHIPSNVFEIGQGAFDGIQREIYLDLDDSSIVADGAVAPSKPVRVYVRPAVRPEGWGSAYVAPGVDVAYGVTSFTYWPSNGYSYYVAGGDSPHAVLYDIPNALKIPDSVDGYPVKSVTADILYSSFVYLPSFIEEIVPARFEDYYELGEIYIEAGSPLEEAVPSFIDPEYLHFGCLDFIRDDDLNMYVEKKDNNGRSYLTLIGSLKSGSELSSYSVPSSFSSIPVKAVGKRAFEDDYKMTSLVIPDQVVVIEERAFSGTHLESVTLGSALERIEKEAFKGSFACPIVYIPESVAYIGESAFFSNVDTIYFFGSDTLPETGNDTSFGAYFTRETFVFSCKGIAQDDAGRHYVIKENGSSVYAVLYSFALGSGIEFLPETVSYRGEDVPVTGVQGELFKSLFEGGDGGEWHFLVLPDSMIDFGTGLAISDSFSMTSSFLNKKIRFLYGGSAQDEFLSSIGPGIAGFSGEIVLYEGAYYASVEGKDGPHAAFLGLEKDVGDFTIPPFIPFESGDLALGEAAAGSGAANSFSSLDFPSSLRVISRYAFAGIDGGRLTFNSSVDIGEWAFGNSDLDGLSFSSKPFTADSLSFKELYVADVLVVPSGSSGMDTSIDFLFLSMRRGALLAFEDSLPDAAFERNFSLPVVDEYLGETFYQNGVGYALVGSDASPYLSAFRQLNMNFTSLRLFSQVQTSSGTFTVRGIACKGFINMSNADIFLPSSIEPDKLFDPFPDLSFSTIYVESDYSEGSLGIDRLAPDGHNSLVYGYSDGNIFTTSDGLTFSVVDDGLYLVSASGAYEATSISVPSSVTCPDGTGRSVIGIADEVFSILPNLLEVRLPTSVRLLGGDLFFGSPNVSRVYLPYNLTHAFDGGIDDISIIITGVDLNSTPDWANDAYFGCEAMAGFKGIEFESGGIVYGLFNDRSSTVAVALYPVDPIDGLTISENVEYSGASYRVVDVALSFVRSYEAMGEITIYLEGTIDKGIPTGEGNVSFVQL